jgi:hypothetical protein
MAAKKWLGFAAVAAAIAAFAKKVLRRGPGEPEAQESPSGESA